MDSRAQFEEWCVNVGTYSLSYADSTRTRYVNGKTNVAWKAWQASREAIEVELPEKISPHNRNESGYVIAQAAMYDEAIDDCAQAVKECGISIKKDLPLQHEAKEG